MCAKKQTNAPWFFANISPQSLPTDVVLSDAELVHRIKTVRRFNVGDSIVLISEANQAAYDAEITALSSKEISVNILEKRTEQKPFAIQIICAVSLIKSARFESMLQKLTELGVAEIQPLITARTIIDVKKPEAKHERWHQILMQAAEQSEQVRIPVLKPTMKLTDWVKNLSSDKTLLKLSPVEPWAVEGLPPLKSVIDKNLKDATHVAYVVGPEGGWTPEEVVLFNEHGFHPVSLGATILRSETAAIMMASAVRYEQDNII